MNPDARRGWGIAIFATLLGFALMIESFLTGSFVLLVAGVLLACTIPAMLSVAIYWAATGHEPDHGDDEVRP